MHYKKRAKIEKVLLAEVTLIYGTAYVSGAWVWFPKLSPTAEAFKDTPISSPGHRDRNNVLDSSSSRAEQCSEKDGMGFDESTNVPHCNAAFLSP